MKFINDNKVEYIDNNGDMKEISPKDIQAIIKEVESGYKNVQAELRSGDDELKKAYKNDIVDVLKKMSDSFERNYVNDELKKDFATMMEYFDEFKRDSQNNDFLKFIIDKESKEKKLSIDMEQEREYKTR